MPNTHRQLLLQTSFLAFLTSVGCLSATGRTRDAVAATGAPAPQSGVVATTTVVPRGEYAKIDTRLARETMQILATGTPKQREKAIGDITALPANYAPPVFYLLSNVLFNGGKKEEGAFWFYAGQVRARFDANRCSDITAREAVHVLNLQYGAPINQFTMRNMAKLAVLVRSAVDWDRKTPHNYDHRWINLHGLDALRSGLTGDDSNGKAPRFSLPQEEWDEIAERTRKEYLDGFEALEKKLEKQPEGTPSDNEVIQAVKDYLRKKYEKDFAVKIVKFTKGKKYATGLKDPWRFEVEIGDGASINHATYGEDGFQENIEGRDWTKEAFDYYASLIGRNWPDGYMVDIHFMNDRAPSRVGMSFQDYLDEIRSYKDPYVSLSYAVFVEKKQNMKSYEDDLLKLDRSIMGVRPRYVSELFFMVNKVDKDIYIERMQDYNRLRAMFQDKSISHQEYSAKADLHHKWFDATVLESCSIRHPGLDRENREWQSSVEWGRARSP